MAGKYEQIFETTISIWLIGYLLLEGICYVQIQYLKPPTTNKPIGSQLVIIQSMEGDSASWFTPRRNPKTLMNFMCCSPHPTYPDMFYKQKILDTELQSLTQAQTSLRTSHVHVYIYIYIYMYVCRLVGMYVCLYVSMLVCCCVGMFG